MASLTRAITSSNPIIAFESVRAMITKSGERRAEIPGEPP